MDTNENSTPDLHKTLVLVQRAIASRRPSRSVVSRYASSSARELRLALKGSLPYIEALVAKFTLAERELKEWIDTNDEASLWKAIGSIADAFLILSSDRRLGPAQKAAAIAAAQAFARIRSTPPSFKRRLERHLNPIRGVAPAPWESVIGSSEGEVRQACDDLRDTLHPTPLAQLTNLDFPSAAPQESTAALLLRGAGRAVEQGQDREKPPDALLSDMSQRKVKLTKLTLSNFRGVGKSVELELSKNGQPASTLIYGDNGVGKSSLVDGIEYALQGRVGRTHNFDSSFAPLLPNLASGGELSAKVALSDGSEVVRTLSRAPSGRLVPDGQPPSPGFRWAPLTLKRSDILRFLDTDPLSRGTVFFDYFPADADAMGTRPDEQLILLEEQLFSLRVRRKTLSEDLAAKLGVSKVLVSSADSLEQTLKERVFAGATPRQAAENGTWDRLDPDLKTLVSQLHKTFAQYRMIKRQIDSGVEILNPIAYPAQAAQLRAVMQEVGAELTSSFLKITKSDYVKRINVIAGETGPVSLDVVVELTNGEKAFPQQIFSEGYRDLLALLFFLAVAQTSTRRGQAKVLVLDDVFQSVDASVRLGCMRHILDTFAGWQLIVTVHDRLWYEQLRGLLRRRGPLVEHRLLAWTLGEGPQISGDALSVSGGLVAALASADAALTCGAAGRLLETIAAEESWRFRTSVKRVKDDKYTLNDLWPGLVKYLGKSSLSDLIREIDGSSELRNLVGAHYNPFADTLSWDEARTFGENVLLLFNKVHCSICGGWLSEGSTAEARCDCGNLTLTLKATEPGTN